MKVDGVGLSKPGHTCTVPTCWTIPELTDNPELTPELILFRLRISALLGSRTYSKTSLEYCLLTDFGSGRRLGAISTAQCRFSPFQRCWVTAEHPASEGAHCPWGAGHPSKVPMPRSQDWASQGNGWSRCIQFVYLGLNLTQNSLGREKNRELAFKGQLLQIWQYCQKSRSIGPKFQLNSHHYKILHCSLVFTCNNCISLFLLTIQ